MSLDGLKEYMDGYRKQDLHFATKALHVGQEAEQWNSMAVVPHICMAATFKQDAPAEHRGFEYGRSGNPTRNILEKCIAAIEGGTYGISFSSGLSATTAIFHMLNAGDHVVSVDDVYGGVIRYMNMVAPRLNIKTTYVDASVDPENIEKVIQPNTKMIWLESPTNPTLKVVDIQRVADIAHRHKDIFLVVDNTFLSPYFQRPLELGADIVMHSLTKYMNGHSDVIMGAVVTDRKDLHDSLRFLQNAIGPVPSPFDCYLVNRSLKTLHIRMKEHMRNGLLMALHLEKHPCVIKVIHPGLPSHPQYELTKRQCYGTSGMVSFYLKGHLAESKKFLQSLKLFILAESLGGYESLAEIPFLMTHASVPEDQRQVLGVTDNLIRLSVGIEDIEDLIKDIDQALRAAIEV